MGLSNLMIIPRRHLRSEVTRQPFSLSSGEIVATVATTRPPANMIVVSQDDFILVEEMEGRQLQGNSSDSWRISTMLNHLSQWRSPHLSLRTRVKRLNSPSSEIVIDYSVINS